MKPVAVVTGAGGLIGNYLVQTAPRWAPEWQVHGWTRSNVELTDADAVRHLWKNLEPRLVIHCAALSKTGACQRNRSLARRVNVEVTAFLAELAVDIPFIFLSSDQVFDGRKGWYVETDGVNPVNVYGDTKAEAEGLVLANPRHTVVRTSLNAGVSPTGDRSFTEEMRREWRARQTLTLFTDEFRCPIPATVTARALWELAAQDQPGLYHLVGADRLSRWEIGQLLAAEWPELEAKMISGSVRDYRGPLRPPDLSLNCNKIQHLLSFILPGFRKWLATNPDGNDNAC